MKTAKLSVALLMLALGASVPQVALAAPEGAVPRVRLDRAYLIGAWTDDGDCADAINFTPDGRFVNPDGGGGNWTLSGDRLTLTGAKAIAVRIVPIDRDRIRVVNPDGSVGSSTRCAAPRPEDAPAARDVT